MNRLLRAWPFGLAVLLLLVLLPIAGCDSDDGGEASAEVKVMTYNLYLGAEIFALVGTQPDQIPTVAGQLFADVRASDFDARAAAIADIVEAENPALIGLQEVTWYRLGPGNDPAPATETEFDFLQILLDALAANGLAYEVAATTTNADVEVPAILPEGLRDVRLTDRDVILARSNVETSAPVEETFADTLLAPVPIGGQVVPFTRGYNYVQAMVEDVAFTFANAHLEVDDNNPQGAALAQFGQGFALTNALTDAPLPIVLVGDFNSAADGSGTAITVTDPIPFMGTTYDLLTTFYEDAAEEVGVTGNTCCQAANLLNPASSLMSRIDLILYRGDVEPLSAEVVGDEAADRTPNGLWPSDHAGVVATLRISN